MAEFFQSYGMDLLGAAAGAAGAIIAINILGRTKAVLVIGLLILTAALLYLGGSGS